MASIVRKPAKGQIGKPPATRVMGHAEGSRASRREKEVRRASMLLKSINDPTRLEILLLLAEREQHVGALCAQLNQSQPAVSHHLALLRHGRIIEPRRQGKNNFYSLTERGEELANLVRCLTGELRSDRLDDNEEESWSVLNRRRAELIFKKNRERLNDAERSELENLQQQSLSRMQREFPRPSHVDEQLRKIEERLRGNGG